MGWFGEVGEDRWKMDVVATVREVGLGILRAFKVRMTYSLMVVCLYTLP